MNDNDDSNLNEEILHNNKTYYINVQIVFDDEKEENIRVIVTVDNGKLLSFIFPKSKSFILSPDNKFVGE